MKPTRLHRAWPLAVIIGILIPAVAAAVPVRIAVLPFSVHADKDYAFLQKGIVEMLASRLSAPGKVMVIDPAAAQQAAASFSGEGSESLAREAGAKLEADFAVHGSITLLEESVSIDAVAVDLNQDRPPLTFFKQTRDLGGVIPQIDEMAEEIRTRLLGVEPRKTATTPATNAPPAPAGLKQDPPADIHMHPDKLLQNTPQSETREADTPARPGRELNPAFQTVQSGSSENTAGFWKSRNYNYLINGFDVGDVDGDKKLETVVADPETIAILRFDQGRPHTVAEIEAGRFIRNISVSVADINGNGIAEIFVTAFTLPLNALESYVLEFDGRRFKRIIEKSRYFYGVVDHPALGKRLLGQRQSSSGATPYDAPIFELAWDGAEYAPDHQVLPGRKANVLGMAYADIMNAGSDSIAALDPYDHLQVILPNGRVEWKDDQFYGGTVLYFSMAPDAPGDSGKPFYLPVRIRSTDLDNDGKTEVLVFRNEGGTGRKLGVRRYFKHSHIEALAWDGLGLATQWKTQQISGRIQDFVIADFDNDGVDELVAAVVSKEGAIIFTDARSSLIAFELNRPR